jgi:hypothetical protein
MTTAAKKTYIANFGTVANLRITQSRGVPMAAFTLDGGEKFSRDVVVFGAERVEKMKEIGNGRKAWVRGEITEITKRNANGGTYKVTGLKGYNLKDITDAQPKAKTDDAATGEAEDQTAGQAADDQAAASVADVAETGAEDQVAGENADLVDEIPF